MQSWPGYLLPKELVTPTGDNTSLHGVLLTAEFPGLGISGNLSSGNNKGCSAEKKEHKGEMCLCGGHEDRHDLPFFPGAAQAIFWTPGPCLRVHTSQLASCLSEMLCYELLPWLTVWGWAGLSDLWGSSASERLFWLSLLLLLFRSSGPWTLPQQTPSPENLQGAYLSFSNIFLWNCGI